MRVIPEPPMPKGPTPNFFLVGAPKAGSTSLNHYLDQHPQIYMSPIKEPHYFADEIRPDNFDDEMRRTAELEEVDACLRSTRTRLGRLNPSNSASITSRSNDILHCSRASRSEFISMKSTCEIHRLSCRVSFDSCRWSRASCRTFPRNTCRPESSDSARLFYAANSSASPSVRGMLWRSIPPIGPARRISIAMIFETCRALNRDLSHWLDGGLITAKRPAA